MKNISVDMKKKIMLEEKIKEMIIEKYGSVRQFSIKNNIPYTTVDSILKRGIDNSNVENIIRICNSLNISIDDLLNKRKITSIEELKDKQFLDTIEELKEEIEELKEEIKRKNKKIKELQEFQKEVCDDIEKYPYGYFGVSESDFH